MEKLLGSLLGLVTRPGFDGKRPERPLEMRADLAGAPASVCALAEAMATHYYNIYLGEFSMFEGGGGGVVSSLASIITTSAERGGIDLASFLAGAGPGGAAFDPGKTLALGADAGGMSYFGVSWSGGRLGLVVVEFEDPIAENLLMHFDSPAQFFAFLDYKNGDEEVADLKALKAAVD